MRTTINKAGRRGAGHTCWVHAGNRQAEDNLHGNSKILMVTGRPTEGPLGLPAHLRKGDKGERVEGSGQGRTGTGRNLRDLIHKEGTVRGQQPKSTGGLAPNLSRRVKALVLKATRSSTQNPAPVH